MTKDGYGIVFGSILVSIILAILYISQKTDLYLLLTSVSILFTLFCINFFRDPDARENSSENQILSPAQGKVVQIKEIDHDDFIGGPAQQISIFLNVFNIHVNSHPIAGTVKQFEFRRGKMLAAFNHMASEQNEQTIICIESDKIRLIHKQITGLIARRIICRVKEGQTVSKGERFGMIRFGSRCDVIMPKSVQLTVQLNQKVERGETVIGEIVG